MRHTVSIAILISIALCGPAAGADDVTVQELKADVLLRAMVDELQRGKVGLELEDLEKPYFIEYAMLDAAQAGVTAQLGAITGAGDVRSRYLRSDVRVGSYKLDNTNFGRGSFGGAGAIPIEGDYNAIRQAIWWATDRQYKEVIENFEKKKAFMQSKMIEDKPDDFSRETPTVYFEKRIDPKIDAKALEKMAVSLSTVFREYPDIQESQVSISGIGGNKYLVNTEGTRIRTSKMRFELDVNVTVQAPDGMKLSDSMSLFASTLKEFPTTAELEQRLRKMAERLIAVKDAPLLDSYTGPVLFSAEPATSLFAGLFAGRFTGGQRPVGSSTRPDDFENKIGKRILPRFMDVVDDPTRETIDGKMVLGNYKYDDQGVQAKPVSLVEEGRLKTLLMSRNPSKKLSESTGHGRSAWQPAAAIGCMIVTADEASNPESLIEQLLEAAEDEDLEFAIRVESLGTISRPGRGYRGYRSSPTPLVIYKVYPDGREELVRGAEIARIDLKSFKRIMACGDGMHVLNGARGYSPTTVAAPAMLFEELDLAKVDRDFDKPPILPTPLARGK